MKKYEPHELAKLFPMMEPDARSKLAESIVADGLMEEIILHEGKILDGRNRYDICLENGIEPDFFEWAKLPLQQRGASPLDYVWAHNFLPRHLTPSQKAVIAAEAVPYFTAEAKKRQGQRNGDATLPPQGGNHNEFNQDNGYDPADESQARGQRTAAAIAAQATGASPRSVERAVKLRKLDPKKLEAVKSGKLTLVEAERGEKKAKAKADELEAAYQRCGAVCGKQFERDARAGAFLKKRTEVLAFAAMNDADMSKCRGLISNGWSVSRAKHYKMTALSRTHSIGDLCLRALAKGGTFSLEGLAVGGATYRITVEREAEAATISPEPNKPTTSIKE